MNGDRCSDLSRAAGEPLAATATTATNWLLIEVPGTWPRDVAAGDGLPDDARSAVAEWAARTPGSRVLFLRRPGRRASRRLAFRVRADEDAAELRRLELSSDEGLAAFDLDADGDPIDGSLVLVCGHGSRDACCALRGTAVFEALSARLGGEELWISSHHGGHRFAPNVLVFPAGLHFGRVDPEAAPFVVARALGGRIELQSYRGRTGYEPRVQAAERAVREAAGADGVRDVRFLRVIGSTVHFRTWDGIEHAVEVAEVEGPSVPASCGAEPEPQRTFTTRLV